MIGLFQKHGMTGSIMMLEASWGLPTPAVRNDDLTGTPWHAATQTPHGTPSKTLCAFMYIYKIVYVPPSEGYGKSYKVHYVKKGEQPKKRISRKREKVISAELRKIIKASSIKYGGAKALMLDDGEGKE